MSTIHHTDSGSMKTMEPLGLRDFWIIYPLSFVVIFGVALLALLVGANWRELLPGAEKAKGLFDGVNASVYTFMSYLF